MVIFSVDHTHGNFCPEIAEAGIFGERLPDALVILHGLVESPERVYFQAFL
jgi:hypothetical protein